MQQKKTFTTTLNDTEIKVSITDIAENANGAVLIEAGDTIVFVTAVMEAKESKFDHVPLSVEFEERFYSVGAILGSRYVRREGRPSQEAVLNARIIDRTIRPLFAKEVRNEIQVVATVLSFGTYNPDTLAIIGASLALGISDIPWGGPVSAVRYVKTEEGWTPFVSFDVMKEKTNHLLLCGSEDLITMIEMEGKEIAEEELTQTTQEAKVLLKQLQEFQEGIIREMGKEKKVLEKKEISEEGKKLFEAHIQPTLKEAIFGSAEGAYGVQKQWLALLEEQGEQVEGKQYAEAYADEKIREVIHAEAVENEKRVDGRGIEEIRSLFTQAGGVSPRLHGTGIFYRGGTRVFSVLTLGGPADALALNTVEDPDANERFMHHYNFPPFSTGETGRIGGPKRREIGHGALAEKAVRQVLPPKETFPYTMRVVSECFSSNGSTSMGSVCATTLALMDGGVPITAPVAGIAIGLMHVNERCKVLTDIQGPEDHYGDMDFKVAGTKNGITAIQMDVKVTGITLEVFKEALEKGKAARMIILKEIERVCPVPRDALSPFAPHIHNITIDPEDIGSIIGSGGKTIKALRAETGVENIDIEDDGVVTISGSAEAVQSATKKIEDMTKKFQEGDEFEGKIRTITDFGAFVEIAPGKDGMVHISEFTPGRTEDIHALVSVGDVVPVVVSEIRRDGKIALSIKDRDPTFFGEHQEHSAPRNNDRREGGGRDRGRDGGGGRRRDQHGGPRRNNSHKRR